MRGYYDTRYILLPVFNLLKTPSSASADAVGVKGAADGSSLLTGLMPVTLFSALFLLVSVRIQLSCARFGRIELRMGGTELSIPLTLSLVATLLAPSSNAFWRIYLFILAASFFSDSIHFFLARISYQLCFLVLRDRVFLQLPAPQQDEEPILSDHQV